MSLYVVSNRGRDVWLAYVDTEHPGVYAYIPNLGRFVFNKSLGQDFYWDREMNWTPVDTQTARKIVTDGELGKLDGRRHSHFLTKFEAETDQHSVEDVFGAQPVTDRTPTAREQTEAKLASLANAKPGEWIAYKTYPTDQRHRARVAANDIRQRKIAAVRKCGLHVDARVTPTVDGRITVEIARTV